jgi:5'-nucleotidase (lipoprotein e(P4) family)
MMPREKLPEKSVSVSRRLMKAIRKSQGLRGAGFVLALVLSAYTGAAFFGHSAAQQTQTAAAPDNEYLVSGILWTQTAAEFRALAYQSFNLARMRFDMDLKKKSKMKRAVVVDVDDTVMDNSRYEASLVLKHRSHSGPLFTDWCMQKEAGAVPGALDFLKYVSAKGARIFYVTNRAPGEKQCTAENLRKLGFPDVTDETLMVREDTSSKEPRRKRIAEKYRIVLLIGDNLNDLTNVFEKKSVAERAASVDQLKDEFGTRFIVIPNAMYGDWEGAVYEYNYGLSDQAKAEKRRSALKGF